MTPRHNRVYRKGHGVATIWINTGLGLLLLLTIAAIAFIIWG
ncbi:MAG: hypothetical protein Q4P23_02880 [Micrococcaceae bacterium]|nr:hypothetical protein [Micrococcaceae bacterium]